MKKTYLILALLMLCSISVIYARAPQKQEKPMPSKKIVQTAGRTQLGDFAPEFAHYNDDVLFGENWNNTDLDLKTRSLLTVTALMAHKELRMIP